MADFDINEYLRRKRLGVPEESLIPMPAPITQMPLEQAMGRIDPKTYFPPALPQTQVPVQAPVQQATPAMDAYKAQIPNAPKVEDHKISLARNILSRIVGGAGGLTGVPGSAKWTQDTLYKPFREEQTAFQRDLGQKKQLADIEATSGKVDTADALARARIGSLERSNRPAPVKDPNLVFKGGKTYHPTTGQEMGDYALPPTAPHPLRFVESTGKTYDTITGKEVSTFNENPPVRETPEARAIREDDTWIKREEKRKQDRIDLKRMFPGRVGAPGSGGSVEDELDYYTQHPEAFERASQKTRERLGPLLNKQGKFDSFGKPMSDASINKLSDLEASVKKLDSLDKLVQDRPDDFGPVDQFKSMIPFLDTEAKGSKTQLEVTDQIILKAIEGGVLHKDDVKRYASVRPNISDPEGVIKSKIAKFRTMIKDDIEIFKKNQKLAGRNVRTSSDIGKEEKDGIVDIDFGADGKLGPVKRK